MAHLIYVLFLKTIMQLHGFSAQKEKVYRQRNMLLCIFVNLSKNKKYFFKFLDRRLKK